MYTDETQLAGRGPRDTTEQFAQLTTKQLLSTRDKAFSPVCSNGQTDNVRTEEQDNKKCKFG